MNETLEHLLGALPDALANDIEEALAWFGSPMASPAHDLRSLFDELGQLNERELRELHAHLCRWAEFYGEQSIRVQAVTKRVRRRLEEQRFAIKMALRRSAPQMPRDDVDGHVHQDEAYATLDRVVSLLDDLKALSEHKAKTAEGQVQAVSRALTGRQIELERERIENNVPARRAPTRQPTGLHRTR